MGLTSWKYTAACLNINPMEELPPLCSGEEIETFRIAQSSTCKAARRLAGQLPHAFVLPVLKLCWVPAVKSRLDWELLFETAWFDSRSTEGLTMKHDSPRILLSYSTVQSPSWAANWFAASQEIPRISRNPKVHYRTHKRPPTVSILGQPNPVHIPTSHLLEIHPNIIHPSTPRSPQWSLSLRLPHQDPPPHLLTHTRHMPSPSHSSRFYHPHNIGWGVQII